MVGIRGPMAVGTMGVRGVRGPMGDMVRGVSMVMPAPGMRDRLGIEPMPDGKRKDQS